MFTIKLAPTFVILLSSFTAPTTHASPLKDLCRYTPMLESGVPLLSTSCPLGKGLWGEIHPIKTESYFWIQCGVYQTPVKVPHVSPLLEKLNKPVWNKTSPSGYHCLIGPYTDYLSALKGQQQVRKIKAFKNSTLREIDLSALNLPESPSVYIQRQFNTQNYSVMLPFVAHYIEGPYREKGELWGRMTYQNAIHTCQEQNLSLPDERFWQDANSSDVFNTQNLPSSVPYWGESKQAYFSSGKKHPATEQSLLNVICVSPSPNNDEK